MTVTSTDCAIDVSVVLPFDDDEDRIGTVVQKVATHLRSLGERFEIIAVDEDSGDNSVALLSLLRDTRCLPELRVLAAAPGEGFAAGARVARGRTIWLLDVERADAPLSPFAWAVARVIDGPSDAAVVPGRFIVCRRTQSWQVLEDVRGRGAQYERRFVRRAMARKLRLEMAPATARAVSSWPSFPLLRMAVGLLRRA